MTKIVLIGAGNLAFHFYKKLTNCNEVKVIQWYSRSLQKIDFAKKQTEVIDQFSQIKSADLYLICVSDDAIGSMCKKINTTNLVVHCAGGVSIDQLEGTLRKGVFYPLQTFSKDQDLSFDQLPFCIETTDPKDQILLSNLAKAMGGIPHKINSETRTQMHIIAVLINNFGNHLLHLGSKLLKEHDISFKIFHPLIEETYQKALKSGPENTQTGPAIRDDQKTIEKHVGLISDENIKKLYLNLTSSIQRNHEK